MGYRESETCSNVGLSSFMVKVSSEGGKSSKKLGEVLPDDSEPTVDTLFVDCEDAGQQKTRSLSQSIWDRCPLQQVHPPPLYLLNLKFRNRFVSFWRSSLLELMMCLDLKACTGEGWKN